MRSPRRRSSAWHGVALLHIAEIARSAGVRVIVTDNRRHFIAALRYDLRVETPAEFLAGLKSRG